MGRRKQYLMLKYLLALKSETLAHVRIPGLTRSDIFKTGEELHELNLIEMEARPTGGGVREFNMVLTDIYVPEATAFIEQFERDEKRIRAVLVIGGWLVLAAAALVACILISWSNWQRNL